MSLDTQSPGVPQAVDREVGSLRFEELDLKDGGSDPPSPTAAASTEAGTRDGTPDKEAPEEQASPEIEREPHREEEGLDEAGATSSTGPSPETSPAEVSDEPQTSCISVSKPVITESKINNCPAFSGTYRVTGCTILEWRELFIRPQRKGSRFYSTQDMKGIENFKCDKPLLDDCDPDSPNWRIEALGKK